jgi:hypothetical protein
VRELGRTKKGAAAAAAAAIGTTVSGAVAEPALAAHPRDTCPGNTLCEWRDPGFTGPVKWWPRYVFSESDYSFDHYDSNTSVGLDNSISSVWNNTDRWVTLCSFASCRANGGGPIDSEFGICVGPNKAGTFAPGGGGWDNVVSAHRTGTAPDHCQNYLHQDGCSI